MPSDPRKHRCDVCGKTPFGHMTEQWWSLALCCEGCSCGDREEYWLRVEEAKTRS